MKGLFLHCWSPSQACRLLRRPILRRHKGGLWRLREKFTCRDCEAISQPPAPFHATPRGFIGPHLLATILFDRFGMHSPLNRQSTRFKCEVLELSTSTLAGQVGYGTAALLPIFDLIEAHAFAAERLFGDDTTIPIQAKDKCTSWPTSRKVPVTANAKGKPISPIALEAVQRYDALFEIERQINMD